MADIARPAGSKNKTKQTARSRQSALQINEQAKPQGYDPENDLKGARCTCCGKYYKVKKGNFPHSKSPLFASNERYTHVCRNCIDKYYEDLVKYFSGNEEKAIERICQIFDWYYDDEAWATTRKVSSSYSRVATYSSKVQLQQWTDRGTNYLDTIKKYAEQTIGSLKDFEVMKEQDKVSISKAQVIRWGAGFTEDEYDTLDAHYKSLKEKIDVNDVIQDNLAKDLCEIKIQQIRARNKSDADMFQKFTKLYQETLKSANLKVKSSDADYANDDDACWGTYVMDIEKFTPADVYRDRALFKDVDGIKDYFHRFIVRPFKNFFTGSNEMDHEFSISAGGEADEE